MEQRLRILMMSFANPDKGETDPPAPFVGTHVDDLETAVQLTQRYISDFELGGGNFLCMLFNQYEQIGTVSYNGRVWDKQKNEITDLPDDPLDLDVIEEEAITIVLNPEAPDFLVKRLNRVMELHSGAIHLSKTLFGGLSRENKNELFEILEDSGAGEIVKAIYVQNLSEAEPYIVRMVDKDWDNLKPIELSKAEWNDLGYSVDEDPSQSTNYWIEIMFKRNGKNVIFQKGSTPKTTN